MMTQQITRITKILLGFIIILNFQGGFQDHQLCSSAEYKAFPSGLILQIFEEERVPSGHNISTSF